MSNNIEEEKFIHNPICKQNYHSLPKIYGSSKTRKIFDKVQKVSSDRIRKKRYQNSQNVFQIKDKKRDFLSKEYLEEKIATISLPRPSKCNHKHCLCNSGKKSREKMSRAHPLKKINKLQPLALQQPDDTQSTHKVWKRNEALTQQIPLGLIGLKNANSHKKNKTQPTTIQALNQKSSFKKGNQSFKNSIAAQTKNEQISFIEHLNHLQQTQNHHYSEDKKLIEIEIQVNLSRDEISQKSQKQILQQTSEVRKSQVFKQYGINTEQSLRNKNQTKISKYSAKVIPQEINQQIKESVVTLNEDKDHTTNQIKRGKHINLEQESNDQRKISRLKQRQEKVKSRLFLRQQYEQQEQSEKPQNQESMHNLSVSKAISTISTISLSSCIIMGMHKKNTQFHRNNNNKKSQKSIEISKIDNGQFNVPPRQSYESYLKKYQTIDKRSFNLRALVQKPLFKIVEEDEGVYFGEYQNQKKNGEGICVNKNFVFQGSYKNDLIIKGSEKNVDGIYKGYFENGKREGYGTFEWYNGQIFQGNWKNGLKSGFGIWRSPKGDVYEGEWLNNHQHGSGRFKHKNSLYVGEFQNFLKHGNGSQKFTNGDLYTGSYKNGKPSGKGNYTWADGSTYNGEFIDGVRCGMGTLKQHSGNIYIGEFKNDFKHGKGILAYASGQKFEGQFEQGIQISGTITYLDGKKQQVKQE